MIASVATTTTPCSVGRSKLFDAVDGKPPETGEAEDRLGEHRAAERDADVQAEHRHDGNIALRRTWRRMTRGSGAPLARAVRT